jgi:RNA polymerase sigma factor (sigma-70 family)
MYSAFFPCSDIFLRESMNKETPQGILIKGDIDRMSSFDSINELPIPRWRAYADLRGIQGLRLRSMSFSRSFGHPSAIGRHLGDFRARPRGDYSADFPGVISAFATWLFRQEPSRLDLPRGSQSGAEAEMCGQEDPRSAGIFDGIAEQHFDPAPNPEEIFSNSQRWERLLALVQALPEEDRSCLFLRAEGMRYREIAHVLGISLGAVSMSLTRSLTRIERADRR